MACSYNAAKAKVVVTEMADALALDLLDKRLVTDQLVLTVGYDRENLANLPGRIDDGSIWKGYSKACTWNH